MNPNTVATRRTEAAAIIAYEVFKVIAIDVVFFDDNCFGFKGSEVVSKVNAVELPCYELFACACMRLKETLQRIQAIGMDLIAAQASSPRERPPHLVRIDPCPFVPFLDTLASPTNRFPNNLDLIFSEHDLFQRDFLFRGFLRFRF